MHEGNKNEIFGGTSALLTRHVDPMAVACWFTVCGNDPTSHSSIQSECVLLSGYKVVVSHTKGRGQGPFAGSYLIIKYQA